MRARAPHDLRHRRRRARGRAHRAHATSASASTSSSACCCRQERAQLDAHAAAASASSPCASPPRRPSSRRMGTGFAHGMWIRDVGVVQNTWGKPEVVFSARGEARAPQARHRRGPRDAHRRGGPAWCAVRACCMKARPHEHAWCSTSRPCRTSSSAGACYGLEGLDDAQVAQRHVRAAPPGHRQRLPAARAATRRRDLLRAAQPRRAARSGASATWTPAKAELVQRFFDGIEKYSPGPGVLERLAALTCRCCTTARSCTGSRRRATGRPATRTAASATTTT